MSLDMEFYLTAQLRVCTRAEYSTHCAFLDGTKSVGMQTEEAQTDGTLCTGAFLDRMRL
jgi:hypothetical protein